MWSWLSHLFGKQQQEPIVIFLPESLTWEEVFANIPTAPSTEVQQQRHKELRQKEEMTEEDEAELNDLFYVMYPQLRPEARGKRNL